jgi:hypothetical protein
LGRGKLLDGELHPYSRGSSGAKNVRSFLDDAMEVVNVIAPPRSREPIDLKARTEETIDAMLKAGWISDLVISKGRFRQRHGLFVNWEKTPWPEDEAGIGLAQAIASTSDKPTAG